MTKLDLDSMICIITTINKVEDMLSLSRSPVMVFVV